MERRRTPLDPYPEPRPEEEIGDEQSYPPELGTDAIAVLEGRTFMVSNARGDVPDGTVGGLLHDDTRFISCWELTLDDRPLSVLASRPVDYYSAAFWLTNPELPHLRASTLTVRRSRFVGRGLHEEIAVWNPLGEPVPVRLRLSVGVDFADLFEVKSRVRDRSADIDVEHDADESMLHFHYERESYIAETNVRSSERAAIEGNDLVWNVELPPRGTWTTQLRTTVRVNETVLEPIHEEFGEELEHSEGALTDWLEGVPRFTTDSVLLKSVFDQSIVDLASLRIAGEFHGQEYVLPAAGLPWFMTLFGRDTLITSLQALWVGPELARGSLILLGSLQGTAVDDFRDEEPGKILHEIRSGELTVMGEKPHSPYFGTADATPLWLVLLSEYHRYSGDDELVAELWQNALAALEWCDRYGDLDGDGYVEYRTRSSQGLGNQCWKDSWDGVQFADGRIPTLPIATAEIQGYVYDAKRRAASLAESVIGDADLAARLRREADVLAERFNRDFWSEARGGFYVIALDGDKAQVDSMTSNMGHLLWSGIVPEERAAAVAARLMSDDLFSGWGVRTLSGSDAGFNPIGYHTGTVWPHDNAIAAMGLVRYGFRDEANRVALAQLEAAGSSAYRLPEALAGLHRSAGRFPVPYPTACSPQAWATGAPFVFIKTMLGLDVRDGAVVADPRVPPEIGSIRIHGMHAFDSHWDVEASGSDGRVGPTH